MILSFYLPVFRAFFKNILRVVIIPFERFCCSKLLSSEVVWGESPPLRFLAAPGTSPKGLICEHDPSASSVSTQRWVCWGTKPTPREAEPRLAQPRLARDKAVTDVTHSRQRQGWPPNLSCKSEEVPAGYVLPGALKSPFMKGSFEVRLTTSLRSLFN